MHNASRNCKPPHPTCPSITSPSISPTAELSQLLCVQLTCPQPQLTNSSFFNTTSQKNHVRQNHHRHRRLPRYLPPPSPNKNTHQQTTGIGLSITKYLLSAPQSHNIVVVARSPEPLQTLKDQYPKQVEILNGDLADFSLAPKAVDLAVKSFGKLDGIVLNHGMLGQVGKISEAEPEQWKYGWDVNFLSLVAFVGLTLWEMGNKTEGKWGWVLMETG